MESKKILIATKTYPSISQKYKETVCTARVLLSEEEKPLQWIEIYTYFINLGYIIYLILKCEIIS